MKQVAGRYVLPRGTVSHFELLSFLQYASGKPVFFSDSTPNAGPNMLPGPSIRIARDIDPLTTERAVELLVAEGLVIQEQTGEDGKAVIHVTRNRPVSEIVLEGDRYVLRRGNVALLVLLKHLQQSTGKPVLYPPSAGLQLWSPNSTVDILNDIDPLTSKVVVNILEENGFAVEEHTCEDGRVVIHVTR